MLTTDGPYAETTEAVGGFLLVDVQDLDAPSKSQNASAGHAYIISAGSFGDPSGAHRQAAGDRGAL